MKIFAPFATDFYKTTHPEMLPVGTNLIYSNLTPRSDKLMTALGDFGHQVVFFGLQGLAKWLLIDQWNETFFHKPKEEAVKRYKRRMDRSFGVGVVDVSCIAALHDMQCLPLLIKALPEGTLVDIRIPVLTIRNTHPDFAWLTNYVESQISTEMWKPLVNGTSTREFRRLLDRYAEITGASPQDVDYQGHDFSFRGMSGIYDATTNGASHLMHFKGTDTITAIDYLEDYYGLPEDTGDAIGGSVPATEHMIMCMGQKANEFETIRDLVTASFPTGIVSVVSDTWDFWRVVTEFMPLLKDEILARKPNALGLAKVVLRPDSGDPVKVLLGDPDAEPGSPQHKGAVQCLWEIFGGTVSPKGFKVLNERIGLIYGDSINLRRAEQIMAGLVEKGFVSTSVFLGIGSFTYQYVTRDSLGIAMKATYGEVDGIGRNLQKDPITDDGTKKSASGLLRVEREDGHLVLHQDQTWEQEAGGLLEPLFEDSRMVRHQTYLEIREIIEEHSRRERKNGPLVAA